MKFTDAFLEPGNAEAADSYLRHLLRRPDPHIFIGAIRQLHTRFQVYASTSPAPLPAPGLIITPEIRCQSELYLPIAEISAVFTRLYHSTLYYPPLLSSTPFPDALSWADLFVALPERFRFSANPARLLEELLSDNDLLTEFLFASFLPRRYYGGFQRYPHQREFLRTWLQGKRHVRCLDAACGCGEETYGLAGMMRELGNDDEDVIVEGWTIEPLEVWAASQRRYPHNRQREVLFQDATAALLKTGYQRKIRFRCADLLDFAGFPQWSRFGLILCNGLLGGPIIHDTGQLILAIENLATLLAPGGLLLAADCFHGGRKKQVPEQLIGELFRASGLRVMQAGEGIGGLKADER